jgi:hypothetical protein
VRAKGKVPRDVLDDLDVLPVEVIYSHITNDQCETLVRSLHTNHRVIFMGPFWQPLDLLERIRKCQADPALLDLDIR